MTGVQTCALPICETGIRILTRLMGLVLAAMAVQFVLDAIKDIWQK